MIMLCDVKSEMKIMKFYKRSLPVLLSAVLLPAFCYAQAQAVNVHFIALLISFFNTVLFVCCLFCIKQYFWPGDSIRLPFHIFNLIFIVVFYSLSLPFLLGNIEYYSSYAKMTPMTVLGKFFFSLNFDSARQWIIVLTSIINVLYIRKYWEDFFNLGIPTDHSKPAQAAIPVQETASVEETISVQGNGPVARTERNTKVW